MSHQSVRLGMPAFQLETPFTVRQAMMCDETLIDRLAQAIVNCYASTALPIEASKGRADGDLGLLRSGAADTDALAELMLADIKILDPRDSDKQI